MFKTLIVGAGVFGIAIGQTIQLNGHAVFYLTVHPEIKTELMNGSFSKFPGQKLIPPNDVFVNEAEAFQTNIYDFIIIAVPSNVIKTVWAKITPFLNNNVVVINLAKGVNELSCWSRFFQENPFVTDYCCLSGPSFAQELLEKKYTLVSFFTLKKTTFIQCEQLFNNDFFKIIWLPEQMESVVCEIGALKNVIAIGLGIISALTDAKNTAAGMLTVAFHDLNTFLSSKYPHLKIDLLQPFALGDVLLTATSTSRNYKFGQTIVQLGFEQAVSQNTQTVEGLTMLSVLSHFQERHHLKFHFFNPLIQVAKSEIDPKDFLKIIWQHLPTIL